MERRVLGLLATRCSFRVPEILFVSNSGFDVRRMVPGRCDPWGLYRRCQDDRRLAQKIGRATAHPDRRGGRLRLAADARAVAGDRRLDWRRCSFRVPEILFVSNTGFDVRRMVPGRCDPWGLYRPCQADRRLAQKIGRAIWQILVEQHTRIVEADAAGWLRPQVPWPETGAWIGERLPSVIDDRGLIRALADVIEEYEGMAVDAADRALRPLPINL